MRKNIFRQSTWRIITFCAGLGLASASQADMRAVGIGVADLQASSQFYQQILGVSVQRTYELGYLNEIVLGYTGEPGAVLVLMNWPNDDRVYDGGNVKVVFNVDDAEAVMQRIVAAGGRIDRAASPIDALPGVLVGLGRDLDNYLVEVIQVQNPQ